MAQSNAQRLINLGFPVEQAKLLQELIEAEVAKQIAAQA